MVLQGVGPVGMQGLYSVGPTGYSQAPRPGAFYGPSAAAAASAAAGVGGDEGGPNHYGPQTAGDKRDRDGDGRGRGGDFKKKKLDRPKAPCPQWTEGFCLWGRRCNMDHSDVFMPSEVTPPTTAQLDNAVGQLARYLYHVGVSEGNPPHKAMVYERVYDMFRRAFPDCHKALNNAVLTNPIYENIGSVIICKDFSRHLLYFRKGNHADVDLGATKSVLMVDAKVIYN
jgi:hypothetical protein